MMAFGFKIDRLFFKQHLSILVSIAVLFVICFLAFSAISGYFTFKDKEDGMRREVDELDSKVALVRNNEKLTAEHLDSYTQVLSGLVPEEEDYFSIAAALEKLSRETGFLITKYSLDVSVEKKDNLSIKIDGSGSPENFISFLKEYRFGGGRLATISELNFDVSNTSKVSLVLTFYSQKGTQKKTKKTQAAGSAAQFRLSPQNITFLNSVLEKTTISLTSSGVETGATDYSTKSNPFE